MLIQNTSTHFIVNGQFKKGSIYHYTNEQTLCALQMVNSGRIAAIFLPGKEFSGNIKIAQYDQWAVHSQGLIIPHQLLLNSYLYWWAIPQRTARQVIALLEVKETLSTSLCALLKGATWTRCGCSLMQARTFTLQQLLCFQGESCQKQASKWVSL